MDTKIRLTKKLLLSKLRSACTNNLGYLDATPGTVVQEIRLTVRGESGLPNRDGADVARRLRQIGYLDEYNRLTRAGYSAI